MIVETLEEVREKLLRQRLEELEAVEAEKAARRREPAVSRKVEFVRGGFQICENGHVFSAMDQENERFWGHLAYIENPAIREAWAGVLSGSSVGRGRVAK